MTAEQLLTADLPGFGDSRGEEFGQAELIRDSWAEVEPQVEEMGRPFYATLSGSARRAGTCSRSTWRCSAAA